MRAASPACSSTRTRCATAPSFLPTPAASLPTDWPSICPAPTLLRSRARSPSLFSPVADHLTMYLAVPAVVQDGQNTSVDGKADSTRYIASERTPSSVRLRRKVFIVSPAGTG